MNNQPKSQPYEILGIGAPILDQIIFVEDSFLDFIPGEKGGMVPIQYETLLRIIRMSGSEPKVITGGSCSNTIKGLSSLGIRCALVGKIGSDLAADFYLKSIISHKILPLYLKSSTPTAQVACLITPDGERTCRAYLGAAQEIQAEELKPEMFQGVKLVHIEGYALMYGSLVERAMQLAKDAGAKISLDLASFEIAKQYKERIIHLISRYTNVVFANELEAKELTKMDVEKGARFLKDLCETLVILRGKEGGMVLQQDKELHYEAFPAKAIDTTGAGDLFASGFLYGYLQGSSLEECARYGALTGSHVVEIIGAEIPIPSWEKIKTQITPLN